MEANEPNVPPNAGTPTVPPQPQYYAPPLRRNGRAWLWVLIGGAAFFLFILAMFTLVYFTLGGSSEYVSSGGTGSDKIGVVELEGVIITPDDTVRQLRKLNDDDSVKAIIVHVNSPGGGAAASEEIYREMRRIRDEKKKPLVVSIETVGASGAYYVSSGASKIYADEASVVGSIGVIAEWYNYADLLKWAKLKNVVIKTGEFKDTGNPARNLTPAEHAYLQDMVDNMKEQFVSAVADGRGLKRSDIDAIANGKVWTGQQALPMHLIDEIGSYRKCLLETAKSVGIKGEPSVVKLREAKRSLLDLLVGDASDVIPTRSKLMEQNVGFYYLWK